MTTRTLLVLTLLAAAGCTTDGNGNNNGEDALDDLPDPRDDMDGYMSQCDGYDSNDNGTLEDNELVAGATSYFVGEFWFDGEDDVAGWEYWILFSNETWDATGDGMDCEIVWEMDGTVGEPQNCGGCDYSLTLHGVPRENMSTCVQALFDFEGVAFDVTYDVRVDGSDAEFYFAGSGDLLGEGHASDDAVVYTSDASCRFF